MHLCFYALLFHLAGGGNVQITNKPVKFNAGPKIPTAADAAKHKVNEIEDVEKG